MKKRIADIIVDTLIEQGVKDCFSVVGGGAMHLNNAFLLKKDKIHTTYNHHEQACAMAAEGYARLSGKIAAVCVTSGPGGTNAINGVQGAWVDSIPMIVISGHPRYDTTVQYANLKLRSRGVQENDIISMVSGITKYAKMILDPSMVKYEIEKAIKIAIDGRRGPVWISVPLDVQGMLIDENKLVPFDGDYGDNIITKHINRSQLDSIQYMLNNSQRPVILTGSGIRTGNSEKLFKEFLQQMDIPIVGGALQADINYNGEKNYYGMSGIIGPRAGNFILESADLILVLANSLSFNQTGYLVSEFASDARFIMIDADEYEAKKTGLHIDLSVVCDIKEFFEEAIKYGLKASAKRVWKDHCKMVYDSFPKYEMLNNYTNFKSTERVPALLFWKEFMARVQNDATINLGNSCSVHGVLQEGVNSPDQRILVNYKCGSMGDDLAESIGSATYNSIIPQYCVTGDGSVMMNLQEFQTIYHYNLPIKTVIFNNNGYGGIRNTCETFFDGLYNGCTPDSGVSFPDFEKISKAFKITYRKCECIGELIDSLEWFINFDGKCVLEIYEMIDEIRGPKLGSIMDENGIFYTPPFYLLSPLIEEKLVHKCIMKD